MDKQTNRQLDKKDRDGWSNRQINRQTKERQTDRWNNHSLIQWYTKRYRSQQNILVQTNQYGCRDRGDNKTQTQTVDKKMV